MIYTFSTKRGPGDPDFHVDHTATYDDEKDATLDAVVGAFVLFLKGVSFSDASIKKFIDHEYVA